MYARELGLDRVGAPELEEELVRWALDLEVRIEVSLRSSYYVGAW